MGFRVTQVQPTPNPNAMKFFLDRAIAEQPTSFLHADAASDCPLARQLFSIKGVTALLFLGDFVTVNKQADTAWPPIKRHVKQLLTKASDLTLNNNT